MQTLREQAFDADFQGTEIMHHRDRAIPGLRVGLPESVVYNSGHLK